MGLRSAITRLWTSQNELTLTDGPIARPLVVLAVPIVLANLLKTVYTLVDTFWLGQYDTVSLAAITVSYPLAFLLLSIGIGLPVAGSIHVAQALGNDNDHRAVVGAAQTVTYSLLSAIVIGLAGFVVADELVSLLGVSSAVHREATAYLRILSLGLPATVGLAAFMHLLRGSGDTLTPLPIMCGSILLNIALDPLLIFGWWTVPELGIRGAGIVTVVTRALGAVVGFWILFRPNGTFDVAWNMFRPDPEWGRQLAVTGVPKSLEQIGQAVALNSLLIVVGAFATPVVAAYGIGVRVLSTITIAANGVSNAVNTITGQNVGAGRLERVTRTNYVGAIIAFCVLSIVAALCWITAPLIVRLFTADPRVVDHGTTFLRWTVPVLGVIGATRAVLGGFRGAGKTGAAAVLVLTIQGIVRVPAAWIGSGHLGPVGLWVSIPLSAVVGFVLTLGLFRGGSWHAGTGLRSVTPSWTDRTKRADNE